MPRVNSYLWILMRKIFIITFLIFIQSSSNHAQNSKVGDGFGGRLWYTPTNYSVGSYSGYSLCESSDGNQLYGWGSNGYNELGLGVLVPGITLPTPIPNMTNVKFYSAGYVMGAIKNDSTGWAWGQDISNENPIQVITNVKFLDASSRTISYIKEDGTVWSIGGNSGGQFGDGTSTSSFINPIKMQTITNAVRVANNPLVTIVLLEDSTLMSVGTGKGLGLGFSWNEPTYIPLPITGIPKIVDIKSNAKTIMALTSTGDIYYWGNSSTVPIILPNAKDIVAISGCDDGFHFLLLDEKEYCYAWGDNSAGQCGVSFSVVPDFFDEPVLVDSNVVDIMAGEWFSYIIKSDQSLWGTGRSGNHSIWLNLENKPRDVFTKIDIDLIPEACEITLASPQENDGEITFPNIFTPNGDGKNDEFYFPNERISNVLWKVYNRWGNLIFESDQLFKVWDGRTNTGEECPEGTYYYFVNYRSVNGNWKNAKGQVTLLR